MISYTNPTIKRILDISVPLGTDLDISVLGTRYWTSQYSVLDISVLTWTSQYSVPGHFGTDLDISVVDISVLTWTSQYSVPGHFGTDLDISVLGTWTFRY